MRTAHLILLPLVLVMGCATAQPTTSVRPNADTIVLPVESMTFRRIDPSRYGTNAPVFFLLETEATNEMYAHYLRDIQEDKGDAELYRQETEKLEEMMRTGRFTGSTADPLYKVENEALLWKGRTPPKGKSSFPVALVRYADATGFCSWLTERHPETGIFRLPTKSEWTLAAYGDKRPYPWGNKWDIAIPCVSSSEDDQRSSPVAADAPTEDITPEGICHLWGNVREYIQAPSGYGDVFWMGASFDAYPREKGWPFLPQQDYWGYVHNGATRMETLGFRVLLEKKESHTTSASTATNQSAPLRVTN